jgi:hypothetical protein
VSRVDTEACGKKMYTVNITLFLEPGRGHRFRRWTLELYLPVACLRQNVHRRGLF